MPNDVEIITPVDTLALLLRRAGDGAPGRVRVEVELPITSLPGLLDAIETLRAVEPERAPLLEPREPLRSQVRRRYNPRG